MARHIPKVLFSLLLAGFSAICYGADISIGKQMSSACGECRGMAGIGAALNYPNLAGQKEAYLARSIRVYRSGERSDPTMMAMVASLSESDIDNLAA